MHLNCENLPQLLNFTVDIQFCFEQLIHQQQIGAVEACWAHNPEVRGSKPRSARFFVFEIFFDFEFSNGLSKYLKYIYDQASIS